ncbi:sulfatase family protein [Rhodococcus sp. MTM3W5.2]|nr:sulfatase family protein [Rhodococcus sp. MTM3W5.2]
MVDRAGEYRGVLPIPDRQHIGLTTYDAKDPDTAFPPIEPLLPPEGAPNVLVILLDDVGYGASSAFGGPANTPTAERLQRDGLTYTRFHTTALCAPTRAALLSGRNHHSVGMGMITETATSAPGSSGLRPNTKAALPMTLKLNGYSTAQFGKCHEVPPWQTSPVGPFDAWPSGGGGFEYFYGFIGGESNQYFPALYDGFAPVEPDRTPEEGYHLTEDLADRAIDWVRTQKSLAPDKPFFVYFARAPPTPRTTCRSNGRTDTRAGSRAAGTRSVNPSSIGRSSNSCCPRRRTDRPSRRDPGMGRHGRGAQVGAGTPDGGVCGVPRAHRLPCRPRRRRDRGDGGAREHPDLLHHRRQRGLRRGNAERGVQRDGELQRPRRDRDP